MALKLILSKNKIFKNHTPPHSFYVHFVYRKEKENKKNQIKIYLI